MAVDILPRTGSVQHGIRLVLCEEQFLAREGIMRVLDALEGI